METMYIILIVLASYTFGFMSGIIKERNNERKIRANAVFLKI